MTSKRKDKSNLLDQSQIAKTAKNNSPNLHQKPCSNHGQNKFQCSFCDFETNQKCLIERHIRVHTGERPYKCPHPNCGAAFSRNGTLKNHKLVHLDKNDPAALKFKCPFCFYKAIHKRNITAHLRTHSNAREFSCDLCPYRAKDRGSLKIHHRHVHSTEKPFKCPQPDCDYSFKSKGGLNRHLVVHSNDRPFGCSFPGCDFRAKRKDSLKAHKLAHYDETPFKCSLCLFSTYDRGCLLGHVRGHTGEAPYSCQSCPYRCKTVGRLKYHVNSVHQGKELGQNHGEKRDCKNKPFKCTFCPYSAQHKCILRVHTRLHTGKFPYFCKSCPYRANRRETLAWHVNSNHRAKKETKKDISAVDNNPHRGKIPIRCQIVGCGFRTRQFSILASHYNGVHSLPRVRLSTI